MTDLPQLGQVLLPILLGPFIGSFVSVLVVRLPRGERVAWDRSRCPSCGQTLGIADLIPLLSWALSRGRCRHCAAPIGALYPILEIVALGLAIWAALTVPAELVWPSCVLGWALLALAAIDTREFILPDVLTLPLCIAGLAVAGWLDGARIWEHVIGMVAGLAVFVAIALAYRTFRGREGLGLGDAKLFGAAGAWVSWTGLPGVLLWGCASALIFALHKRLTGTAVTGGYRIAFGAHLCLGIWLVWLYGPPMLFFGI